MTNPFRPTYRRLSEAEQEQVEQIKDKAHALYLELERAQSSAADRYTRDSITTFGEAARYVALAKTALEEAVMWATKAVTT